VQIARAIERNVVVCRWVGLAVLLVQVACMGLAYALSSAQQRLLLDASMCAPAAPLSLPTHAGARDRRHRVQKGAACSAAPGAPAAPPACVASMSMGHA